MAHVGSPHQLSETPFEAGSHNKGGSIKEPPSLFSSRQTDCFLRYAKAHASVYTIVADRITHVHLTMTLRDFPLA